MKKLKSILQSNFSILLLVLIAVIVSTYKFINKNNLSYYHSDSHIEGYITEIIINGNKLELEIKAKEKIISIYYIKTEAEKKYISNNYHYGDYLKLEGTITVPSSNSNFNLFNYRNYLLSKKIYNIFTTNKITKLKNNRNIVYNLKTAIINRIKKIDYKGYLLDFIIGNNDDIESGILDDYQKLGISHLLAISGMHITLLTSLLFSVLSRILRKEKLVNISIISFLLIYIVITDFSTSVIRASILYILLLFNKKYQLNIKTIKYLIIIFLVMIIYNPFYFYDIGFLFSLIISFYLILFSKLINNYNNYFSKILITSLVSFLVGLPIVIQNFYSINLLSPLINVIMVPFVSLVIYPLSLIVFVFPYFKILLILMINILEFIANLFSKITIGIIILPKMSVLIIILYYILITIILFNMYSKKYYQLLYLLIVLIIHSNIKKLNPYFAVTILDIGQGDSILIEMPFDRGNILIDTGGVVSFNNHTWQLSKNSSSKALNIIIPYLKSIGEKKLDYVIISHGDFDHMGEAINLVNNFKVKNVVFNCGEYNDLEKELINILDKKNIKYYSCLNELNVDKYKLQFLNTGVYDNENDNSSVIYFNYNSNKFLFMGDAGTIREKNILDKYNLDNMDFLKVGHHGSNTSSSEEFINSINPKYSLISVGKNNRYGHPKESVLDILSDSKIYRTDLDGSIEVKLNKNGYKIRTCLP